MTLKVKAQPKKHHHYGIEELDAEMVLREATDFLQSLEDLRHEIIIRDETYQAAKKSGNHEQMKQYHELASQISQKCLAYGRELCDKPVPHWVVANMTKDNAIISRHAYDVVRNKLCSSLNVFDNDLLPNARALVSFAEGRF